MALPEFSMHELVEAGVHFGHKTKRWNPQMEPFIFGTRNDIHIIDLQKTVPLLHNALSVVRDAVRRNGRVLFVGTKRQASDPVAEAARRCGQYYVNKRWLGGMLTNWNTIQASIKRLRSMEETLKQEDIRLPKKEIIALERQRAKLDKSLGGIRDMGGLPDLIFIIDTNREDLAVKEAARLGIPVIAVVDSNSALEHIAYPIPGNDDASRAIKLYCRLISDAALSGLQESVTRSGRGKDAEAGKALSEPAPAAETPKQAEEERQSGREGSGSSRRRDAKAGKEMKKAPAVVVKKPSRKTGDGEAADMAAEPASGSSPAGEGETAGSKDEASKKQAKA